MRIPRRAFWLVLLTATGAGALADVAVAPVPAAAESAAALLSGDSPFKADIVHVLADLGVPSRSEQILGPFSDVASRIGDALYESILPGARTSSLHWPLLLLTGLIAIALYGLRRGRGARGADGCERRRGLADYLLPGEIYRHVSARVDVGLYLVDRALMPVWTVLFLGALAPFVERTTIRGLEAGLGPSPAIVVTPAWQLLYGLVTLLVVDMVFYFTHLFGHRTRFGWIFHKVHHSAEVLTPLTRYREHFVEGIIYAATVSTGAAFATGLFAYLFAGRITQITIMNLGVLVFLFTLTANFRHYHVSLRFPRVLERWLQSPGMHHVHHSRLPEHWGGNLGLVTSVWDRWCGTLYVGEPYEATPWGLSDEEQASYRSLSDNVFRPLAEAWQLIRDTVDGRFGDPSRSTAD